MTLEEFITALGVPTIGTVLGEPINCGAGLAIDDETNGGDWSGELQEQVDVDGAHTQGSGDDDVNGFAVEGADGAAQILISTIIIKTG